jgi:hypothetical protein
MPYLLVAALVTIAIISIFKLRGRRSPAYRALMRDLDKEFAAMEAEKESRKVSLLPVPTTSEHDRATKAYALATAEYASDSWNVKRPWFAMKDSRNESLSLRWSRN